MLHHRTSITDIIIDIITNHDRHHHQSPTSSTTSSSTIMMIDPFVLFKRVRHRHRCGTNQSNDLKCTPVSLVGSRSGDDLLDTDRLRSIETSVVSRNRLLSDLYLSDWQIFVRQYYGQMVSSLSLSLCASTVASVVACAAFDMISLPSLY